MPRYNARRMIRMATRQTKEVKKESINILFNEFNI